MINAMHPAEIAHLLESLPPAQRELTWELVNGELDGDVLVELSEEVRAELLREMDTHEIVAAAEGLDVDDLADLLAELPEVVTRQVLHSMDQQDRVRLTTVLGYPEDSAGGLMNTDTVTVRPDVNLGVVLRYLRMRGELPERTDCLFVVDRHDRYLGALPVTGLLTGDEDTTVSAAMDSEVGGISPDMPAGEVAQLFEGRDLLSAAVIGAGPPPAGPRHHRRRARCRARAGRASAAGRRRPRGRGRRVRGCAPQRTAARRCGWASTS